ncbi:monovalent cation/H(+) antiporter subunit G [Candidatus Gracilibacteria bacterium]|nr:monovalent cation/H(+) antiporter subunit G [Candidatus Gracilibacteria bacterium]
MTIVEFITVVVIALGVFFMLLTSIGIVRLPDLYTRVHAAGKASTLGIAGVLLGVAIYSADWTITIKMIALIGFFLFTNPVAAHMLDRAAYLTGVKAMDGTAPDDLAGRYDPETRRLR